MLLSLKTIKKIECIKVELRLALQKLSDGIHTGYQKFLISQHKKRDERIQFAHLKKQQLLKEGLILLEKITNETVAKAEKLEAEQKRLRDEKANLFAALNPFKGNLGGK